ncbi:MAG: trypsin-like serine protease [Hoeflea sp.]|uniref:trypsin-like serine protease n=1 Tax=Hoeflea sp. TaxID=1940281 RepID=UPI003EF50646
MANNGSNYTTRFLVAGLGMTAVTLFASSARSSDLTMLRSVEAAASGILIGNPDPIARARSREILNEAGFVNSLMSSEPKRQAAIGNIEALSTYFDPQTAPYADVIFDPAARNTALFQSAKLNEELDYMTMLEFSDVAGNWQTTSPGSLRTGWNARLYPYAINGQPVVRYDRSLNGEKLIEWGLTGERDWWVPDAITLAGAELMQKFRIPDIGVRMTDGTTTGDIGSTILTNVAGNSDIPNMVLSGAITTSEPDCTRLLGARNCFLPAMAIHNNNETTCSGTLIGSEWVLAASHCFCRIDPTHVTMGSKVHEDGGVVLSPALSVGFAGVVKHYDPEFCIRYNGRDQESAFTAPDIALVKLERPLRHSSKQISAVLGTPTLLEQLDIAEMVGFGATEYNDGGGKKLVVSVKIASKNCDKLADVAQYECLLGKELVAVDPLKKKDSCNGDSGGGVYARLDDGSLALLAVVSRGIQNRCGVGGIYVLTTTKEIRSWLAGIVPDLLVADSEVTLAADLSALNPTEEN